DAIEEGQAGIVAVLVAAVGIGDGAGRAAGDLEIGQERPAAVKAYGAEELGVRVGRAVEIAGTTARVIATIVPRQGNGARGLVDREAAPKLAVRAGIVIDAHG